MNESVSETGALVQQAVVPPSQYPELEHTLATFDACWAEHTGEPAPTCGTCGAERDSWEHCWRIGGHLGEGCGCRTRALDLPPAGAHHYFEPVREPAPTLANCELHETAAMGCEMCALAQDAETLRVLREPAPKDEEALARAAFKAWADQFDPMNPDMFWDNLYPNTRQQYAFMVNHAVERVAALEAAARQAFVEGANWQRNRERARSTSDASLAEHDRLRAAVRRFLQAEHPNAHPELRAALRSPERGGE